MYLYFDGSSESKKALLTQDILVSCGIISRSSCCLCKMHVEDHDHLFLRVFLFKEGGGDLSLIDVGIVGEGSLRIG